MVFTKIQAWVNKPRKSKAKLNKILFLLREILRVVFIIYVAGKNKKINCFCNLNNKEKY